MKYRIFRLQWGAPDLIDLQLSQAIDQLNAELDPVDRGFAFWTIHSFSALTDELVFLLEKKPRAR